MNVLRGGGGQQRFSFLDRDPPKICGFTDPEFKGQNIKPELKRALKPQILSVEKSDRLKFPEPCMIHKVWHKNKRRKILL